MFNQLGPKCGGHIGPKRNIRIKLPKNAVDCGPSTVDSFVLRHSYLVIPFVIPHIPTITNAPQ